MRFVHLSLLNHIKEQKNILKIKNQKWIQGM